MKRSMKKYLMLLLAILSLMTLGVLGVSAEEPACNHGLYHTYSGSVHEPTCTDAGYTEVKCGNCDAIIGREDPVPAKGHKFKWDYVQTGDHFEKRGSCGNCRYVETQKDGDGNEIIYYGVTLKNPAVAKSYYTNIKYTNVVSERKGIDAAETFGVLYIEAGEKIRPSLPEHPNIPCEKDIDYGKYEFIGWFDRTDEPIIVGSGDEGSLAIANLPLDCNNYLEESSDSEDATRITKNMELYAGFRGVDCTYTVGFYNYDGKLLGRSVGVHHGGSVAYNLETPIKPYDMVNRYTFDYWSYFGNEVMLNHIYADVSLTAHFDAKPRQYNIEYYFDAACTKPVINMDVVVKDSNIEYGEKAINGLEVPEKIIEKGRDDVYIYEWTGKWILATRQDYVVNLESFTVPNLTPDAIEGSTCVRVIPQYLKKARVYDLNIQIAYPDDSNYHPDEVHIQLLYANGKIADVRTITMDGDTYSYTAKVNYSETYTLSVTSTGYSGETISHFFSNESNPYLSGPSNAIVLLEKVGAYSCGCICHTFLKPVWVRVLRLLHTLFGLEHVCCSDMFANIGPNLNYGPGKS